MLNSVDKNLFLPHADRPSLGRVILERRTVHVDDVLADPEYTDSGRQQAGKYRTVLGVPLLREQEVIGVIVLVHGKVKPFTQKQIDLVSIFY